MRRAVPVPYLARRPGLLLVAVVIAMVTVVTAPQAFVHVGLENPAPRAVSPVEYAAMATALVAALTLRPRHHDWDRHGHGRRTRGLAFVNAGLTSAVALAVAGVGLTSGSYRGLPEVWTASFSNVAVAALLAVLTIGTLGAGAGSLTWLATMYATMTAQSLQPSWHAALPLTIGFTPDDTPDLAVRWWWLAGLALLTAPVLSRTRGVPLLSLRRPDDD